MSTSTASASAPTPTPAEEHFDIMHPNGTYQNISKPRRLVHKDGDWHRSVHIWLVQPSADGGKVLMQRRAPTKDTFPNRWDVSSAGHIDAGSSSVPSALRELEEELGIVLKPDQVKSCPPDAKLDLVKSQLTSVANHAAKPSAQLDKLSRGLRLEYCFTAVSSNTGTTPKHGSFIDNEFQDVYVLWLEPEPSSFDLHALALQESELTGVQFFPVKEYQEALKRNDSEFVPRPADYQRQFFELIINRCLSQ